MLAYNARLERHHLRLHTWIASLLFLRGVPLDRIWLRPRWLVPWKRDRSVYPARTREFEGRPFSQVRKRVAILTPYFPFPLSHGGAVRIFSLLREIAAEFDIVLLAFSEGGDEQLQPVLELCARVVLIDKPRYREPRWSTIAPPEVGEYRSPAMVAALARVRREYAIVAVQVEYTALAPYGGDVLVAHDVNFSLYEQIQKRAPSIATWWNYWRWYRFERKWARRYRRVAVMSKHDGALLPRANTVVIPNGVDFDRFRPEIERPGERLLFVGSFRHFPNIVAFRFFVEQVWPLLCDRFPDASVTVVAGPSPSLYWREYTNIAELPADKRVRILEFVSDVAPLYIETNLVLVPTLVSAGTNLKVLEALAMERAVVSTSCGCAGLGLEHGVNIWIADSAEDFAAGVAALLADGDLRRRIADNGRRHVEANFGWPGIGEAQRAALREITGAGMTIRRVQHEDVDHLLAMQAAAREGSQWTRQDYLTYDCHIAVAGGRIAGFIVSRPLDERQREILNVGVSADMRRNGIAAELIRAEMRRWRGAHFLEVRESNEAARRLYRKLGFEEIGTRQDYYDDPSEAAIVMRIYS